MNAPLKLIYDDFTIGLRYGAYVDDIDTVIDSNSNNSQLVTAGAIKSYVDTQVAGATGTNYTHLSNFTDDIRSE